MYILVYIKTNIMLHLYEIFNTQDSHSLNGLDFLQCFSFLIPYFSLEGFKIIQKCIVSQIEAIVFRCPSTPPLFSGPVNDSPFSRVTKQIIWDKIPKSWEYSQGENRHNQYLVADHFVLVLGNISMALGVEMQWETRHKACPQGIEEWEKQKRKKGITICESLMGQGSGPGSI